MARKVLIQIRYGLEMNIGNLMTGEMGFCTDTQKLYIGTSTGNVLLVAAETAGDMLKSIYDTDNDGIVDIAKRVNGYTVESNVPVNAKFTDTVYTHPTSAGSNHIPTGGSVGQVLKNTASGIATWQSDSDTITTVNGKTGAITKADIVALGIPAQDTIYTHPTGTNPHGTTKTDIGLGSVLNYGIATQVEAETGTSAVKYMTPLNTKQAIIANALPIGPITWNQLKGV